MWSLKLNLSTEVPMSVSRHQKPPSSPNALNPQDADTLHMVELSPVVQSSAAQLAHDQPGDEVTAVPDLILVRADTEQRLGDGHDAAEQRAHQGPPQLLTSTCPAGTRPYNYQTSEEPRTWRAHHQDFYASKWFRFLEIIVIVSVIVVAVVVFLFASPGFEIDLFGPFAKYLSLVIFLSPVAFFLCIVVGGVFTSKLFR